MSVLSASLITPIKALKDAYKKTPVPTRDFQLFITELQQLLTHLDREESEEHAKTLMRDFLQRVWYSDYSMNTKGRIDLVIHADAKPTSAPAVLLEVKRPQNKSEFPTPENLNCKALHELLLYFLQERGAAETANIGIKHLVMTNGYQWYIIDAVAFERHITGALRRKFTEWHTQGHKTDVFYKDVAQPFFAGIKDLGEVLYIDFHQFKKGIDLEALAQADKAVQGKTTAYYKVLSPQFLLKQNLRNDQNTLNSGFYRELLHILGLHEYKDPKTKKLLIDRLPAAQRHPGSMLENAIAIIASERDPSRWPMQQRQALGATHDEQVFNAAFTLCITWLNRILFLKLLEAQLKRYHPREEKYAFLHPDRLRDFDELNKLFFRVLATKTSDRSADLREKFGHIPYLNSSLFELTEVEDLTIRISNLDDHTALPLHDQTVLKDAEGRQRRTGSLYTLPYLLQFLEAYNFSSEASGELQNDSKSLVSAKVLGLFFEKINGYKDGSIYTPDYITEYMCAQTIARAVLDRFAEHYGIPFATMTELENWSTRNLFSPEKIVEAGRLIDQLRICDPAVGSGHFLVSALNELIAIKSRLGLLTDSDGKALPITLTISQDELLASHLGTGEPIYYTAQVADKPDNLTNKVQRVLFHQKQQLIENCLFGVDINPNSVKICQLRLWIELLKNAYYNNGELQTLPNIDINIKCGNSLVSRYPVDVDLSDVFRGSDKRYNYQSYLTAVKAYKTERDKDAKRTITELINTIKQQIRQSVSRHDERRKKLAKARGELLLAEQNSMDLFGDKYKTERDRQVAIDQANAKIARLEREIAEEEEGKKWQGAFEWRYEFPEVLNDDGTYRGFDIVIGNPPYIRQEELGDQKELLKSYTVYAGTADLYQYFFERGLNLARPRGLFSIIVANKWMLAGYGQALRRYLQHQEVREIIDFGDLPVFDSATTYPCIITIAAQAPAADHQFPFCKATTLSWEKSLAHYVQTNRRLTRQADLQPDSWNLSDTATQALLAKIKAAGIPLGEYVQGKIYYGIKTGLNEAFVIDSATRDRLIAEDPKSAEVIKPFLAGRDVKRYQTPKSDRYLIFFPKGKTKASKGKEDWLEKTYPAVARYLKPFEEAAKKRGDKGDFWWELRACDYYDAFESSKIIYPNILKSPEFTFDSDSWFTNQKCFIIPTNDFVLLGILNSRVNYFLFSQLLPKLRGDFYEPSTIFFAHFPIARADKASRTKIEALVSSILQAKAANQPTAALEAQIDQLVYQLYGLTPEEIALVEGAV